MLSSLFSRYLATQQVPVIAIDADINQHLGVAIGLTEAEAAALPPMGLEIERVKDYLRGSNTRISSSKSMMKTTPPGNGSRLLRVCESNALYTHFARKIDGIWLLATGPFSPSDLGLHCYHSKIGAVELVLNHLLDGTGEYVVVDMTAGADSFASGMFTKFDMTFLVAEPTTKALGVYRQYKEYANSYDVSVKVIGNKIETEDDLVFLREQVGNDLLTWVGRSDYIRAMEKGRHQPLGLFEEENRATLALIKECVDACQKDWEKLYRQTLEFHRKNALDWANALAGEDLTRQVDPDYSLLAHIQPNLSCVS